MKRQQIQQAIKTAIAANEPLMIYGSPGLGKSDTVKQVAKELDMDIFDIRASLLDPVDLRGLPVPNIESKEVNWLTPEFWPRENKPSIVFFDEITNAAPSVQTGLLQILLDRQCGSYKMPSEVRMLAAGNLSTDKAGSSNLITSLKSRFLNVTFEADLVDWIEWALENDIDESVRQYVRFRPGNLHAFDPRSKENAFPCPRSWEKLSNVRKVKVPSNIEYELYSGIVGQAAATEYVGFLRTYREMPDIAEILMNPSSGPIPEKAQVKYAVCGSLAMRANQEHAESVLTYAQRLPKEFEAMLVSDSLKLHGKEFSDNSAFSKWASKNQI
jgi:MoxR-like ATPase